MRDQSFVEPVPLIRGNALVNIRAFIEERDGTAGLNSVCDLLDYRTATLLRNARWAEWYVASSQIEVLEALDRVLGKGDLSLVEQVGRFQCERDLRSPLGWLLRVFPPGRVIEQMDVVWRRFHNTGTWTAGTERSTTWARLVGWRGGNATTCRLLKSYLERAVSELSRATLSLSHPSCAFAGAPCCEYRVGTRFEHFPPLPFLDRDSLDAAAFGRELTQLSSSRAVLDAIRIVLETHVSAMGAELFLDGESAPVVTVGRPMRPYEHLWILENRGRMIGRLCGNVSTATQNDPRLRLVSDLVPWFAIALDVPTVNERESWASKIAVASDRWQLTPRQREVLALLVRGETNRQIALALERAEATVEVHVKALLRKAGVGGRTELTARVAECHGEQKLASDRD